MKMILSMMPFFRVNIIFHEIFQKSVSGSGLVRLSQVTLDTGGVFRCEVSNEFPDFDTVTTAEILNVVGERENVSELQSLSDLPLVKIKLSK